jgi:hypothetical protein
LHLRATWRTKNEHNTLLCVALRDCQACRDLTGTDHTADVTADSLYEAVARALSILQKDAWAEELGNGLTELKVRVRQPAVEHRVRMKDFWHWLGIRARHRESAA